MTDKENIDPDHYSLEMTCNLCVEISDCGGNLVRKSVHKNANLNLMRNELRHLVLKVNSTLKFQIGELTLNKRFCKEGKATLQLPDQNAKLMISNCAPNQLLLFLRTLSMKFVSLRDGQTGKGQNRRRLLSEIPRTLTEISPVNVNDVKVAINRQNVANNTNATPVRDTGNKRKRVEGTGEENESGNFAKVSRSLTELTHLGLTEEQTKVLNTVLSGCNVFFTGGAGTGKSFLLKKIVRALPPDVTFVTASTGVAASQIGGITLHAFSGIGSESWTLEQCIAKITGKSSLNQWRKCRYLIVDEISMVSGEFFAKLEKIARLVRRNDRPFGGIQLVLCGDFFQLPPVSRDGTKRTFCFQTEAWTRCVDVSLELVRLRRQVDPKFIAILKSIRVGRCTDQMCSELMATTSNVLERDGFLATHLCTHNEDVKEINENKFEKLTGDKRVFNAIDSEPTLNKWFDLQCPAESRLFLKIGTQVMLLKNLDVQRGLVNGARGIVVAFENGQQGLPLVKFVCGVKTVIKFERWIIQTVGGAQLVRKQIPLKLAWAISVHKAQGMTLDCVEMSLSKVFECGQAYVALSRARSLQGLRVLNFNKRCVQVDAQVSRFYSQLTLM